MLGNVDLATTVIENFLQKVHSQSCIDLPNRCGSHLASCSQGVHQPLIMPLSDRLIYLISETLAFLHNDPSSNGFA